MDLSQIRSLLQDENIEAVDLYLKANATEKVIRVEEIGNKSTSHVLFVKKPVERKIDLKNVGSHKGIKKNKNSVSKIIK
ncbi:hypothetical protein [Staphylococcus arlettae]|uniref:hypothetical protein n=1 Tax=Staphylococcus arlettae TaxID=29378 RepID=UPI003EDFD26C